MKIKIYFTSDVHGHIYPTDYRDTELKNQGYLCMLNEFDKTSNTIIIDGGDTIQGSPFTTYLKNQSFETHPVAQVLNEAPYDLFITGNHDFNYGEKYLMQFIDDFNGTCLAANVKYLHDEQKIKPYKIFNFDKNYKIVVLGLTTDCINVWESSENIKNFKITNTYNTVRDIIQSLPQHDMLIGVYHGGFEYNLATGKKLSDSTENIAYKLCQDFPFDILLTGHQHTPIINQSLFGTYIAQTPANGEGYAEIEIDISNKSINSINGAIKAPSSEAHPELSLKMLGWETQVQTWLDTPIGFLDIPLAPKEHLKMALEGTYLANFFNQVQLDITEADISCTSMANSVKGFNKEVTVRDVVSTYVYPNTLVVKKVTGEILKQALEKSASYFKVDEQNIAVSEDFLKPKLAHYNYDFFSNIEYTFNLNKPVGQRVESIMFKNKLVKPEDTFSLAMNNYRASGTGGYEFYRDCETIKEFSIDIAELIINYFQEHKNVVVDKTSYMKIKAPK